MAIECKHGQLARSCSICSFLTDVITAAGLLTHGKRDKRLAERIGSFAFDAMRTSAPTPPEPEPVLVVETEPGYWSRGHYYEGTKSYIDPTKVWGLPVGTKLYTAPPAPSVPVKPMENIALNEWLDKTEWVQKEINTFPVSSLGMHRADVMRLEIERLRKLLSAAPTPAEAPADVARDTKLLDWLDAQNKRFRMEWQVDRAPAGDVSINTVIVLGTREISTFRNAVEAAMCLREPAIDAAREQQSSK